jgi:hypothetical protein
MRGALFRIIAAGRIALNYMAIALIALQPAAAQVRFQAPTQSQPQAGGAQPVPPMKAIKDYRSKPDPRTVPALIRTLSQQGALAEPETSGLYVGFLAGVLGSNPKSARTIVDQILPLPFEDQWVVIRAVAYSGLPQTPELLRSLLVRLPDRWTLTERYLTGAMLPINRIPLEPPVPSTSEKFKRAFEYDTYFGAKKTPVRQFTFASNPELIDTCWGLYFATGKDAPVERIISLLPWSIERDNVDKLTIGAMTKMTLAANAAHDVHLLRTLKRLRPNESKEIQPVIKEIVEAAETADTAHIKKELVAAVDDLRKKGPGFKRDIAAWGTVGETAISLGCLGAAVSGQVEFGLPCVIGGALSTAAIRYFAAPE